MKNIAIFKDNLQRKLLNNDKKLITTIFLTHFCLHPVYFLNSCIYSQGSCFTINSGMCIKPGGQIGIVSQLPQAV